MIGRIHVSVLAMVASVVTAGCVTTGADGAKAAGRETKNIGMPAKAESGAVKSGKTESHVEVAGERVTVFVYIDTEASDIPRRMLEPTAMLRTKGWLRKEFKVLPRHFNVPCRVLSRGFDDDDVIYRYITEYKLKDIEKLLTKQEEN